VIRDMVRAGKLRALAVADRNRMTILPDVPTMAEGGYPIVGLGWNGLFVPAGTPRPIVERLHKEMARVLQLKEISDGAVALGTLLGGESPDEFGAFVRAEVQTWGKVIKDAGIKVE
jgi:tripartite-type tricarboxylate transporter receptor subunit TctC